MQWFASETSDRSRRLAQARHGGLSRSHAVSAAAASDGTHIATVLLIRRAISTAEPMARTGGFVRRSSGSRQVRWMRSADAHNATTLVDFVVHEVARGQALKTLSSSLILGDKLQLSSDIRN